MANDLCEFYAQHINSVNILVVKAFFVLFAEHFWVEQSYF